MPYYPPSQAPPPNLILSSAFISDSYQVSVWTQLGAVISTLPPPSMRNITLNLLFLHWQKYQEVSLNDSNMPALLVCQKDSSAPCKWLAVRETLLWSYHLQHPQHLGWISFYWASFLTRSFCPIWRVYLWRMNEDASWEWSDTSKNDSCSLSCSKLLLWRKCCKALVLITVIDSLLSLVCLQYHYPKQIFASCDFY